MEITVIGGPEFTLGFRLAGITRVVNLEEGSDKNADRLITEMMQEENTGILITDDRTMESLSERTREKAESSVKPVVVVVSTEATAQEALRKMIIKSIGVDLWKDK